VIPRLLEQLEQGRREFSWQELCEQLLPYPYSSIMRWKARAAAGLPLIEQAGPKKKEPINIQIIKARIESLDHGRRRTQGTTALYQEIADQISRRDLQELVREERKNRLEDMKRVQWLKAGMAWSMDTTEYGPLKTKITPLRDLGSKYQLPPPLVEPRENGQKIASYLDIQFRKHGPPMFIKRDWGSPLNCAEVDAVLENHRVLPLNSPPGYPQYNGSAERTMQDLQAELDRLQMEKMMAGAPLILEAQLATHNLNHRRLRSLNGSTPCHFHHDPKTRLWLQRPFRDRIFREIIEQYCQIAQCMPDRNRHRMDAAWRRLVESWLRCQGWIIVRENSQQKPNVSTDYNGFLSQN